MLQLDPTDFRSISYVRMYMTGFDDPVVLRFATLDLVRGDWRNYTNSLQTGDDPPEDDATIIDVNTVNIEENSQRTPIPYVLPPGVQREQLNNNNTIIRQNEQSLSFRIENLEPEDSRGVFKNVNVDMRQYQRLKMFMHAEKLFDSDYLDDDVPFVGFLRMGTDFTDNFYQVEVPLEFTPFGSTNPEVIWPAINELDIALQDLRTVKSQSSCASSMTCRANPTASSPMSRPGCCSNTIGPAISGSSGTRWNGCRS